MYSICALRCYLDTKQFWEGEHRKSETSVLAAALHRCSFINVWFLLAPATASISLQTWHIGARQ